MFCSGCGSSTHPVARCWTLHPEFKPLNVKDTGNVGKAEKNGNDKPFKRNTKPVAKKVGNKTGEGQQESRFKTIEAQLASIVDALKPKNAPKAENKETPSYYGAWDESFSGMAERAYVTTRAKAQEEVPRGATSSLDPQGGEARQQVRFPESFILEDLSSTPPPALQKDAETSTSHKARAKPTMEGKVSSAAAVVCQTPLFLAQMIKASGFNVATVLVTAAAMCKAQDNQPTALVRTGAHAEVDSEAESTVGV